MLAVARNRAIDYLRSAGGRERHAVEYEETGHPSLYCDMEKDILSSDKARVVKSAIRKLSPNQRQVIELAHRRLLPVSRSKRYFGPEHSHRARRAVGRSAVG